MEKRGKFTLQWDKLAAIVKVGLPTAIQMVVVNTAYLLVAGMLNQFGTAVSAASNVGLQINTFAGMPCWAIGQAVTAMVGQCMGAGQIERARKVVKISLVMNVVVTLVVVIGVQFFAEPLILLFGSTTPEVVNDGVYYLRVCCSIDVYKRQGNPISMPTGARRTTDGRCSMLSLCPVSLAEANAFVAEHHRHHKPVRGHKFSLGCMVNGQLVGVAIVGRPVSRYLDDGLTLEVNWLCTDGTQNACSFLYGAAARAARTMGYRKIITYILDTENGVSLRAAGWKCAGLAGGRMWTGKRRPSEPLYPAQMKYRYEKEWNGR